MISRDKYTRKIKNFLAPDKVVFVLGARRVGKTTLLKSLQEELLPEKTCYYSFDDIASLPRFRSTQDFLNYISIQTKTDLENIDHLFLDEVQHVPDIEIFCKDLVDNYRKFSLLASGSGSFEIFHNIRESLLGRKETVYMYPLSFTEFLDFKGEDINFWQTHWYEELFSEKKILLDEYLRFGGYPSVVCIEGEEEKFHELKNIVDTWMDIDIRLLIETKEFFGFRNFVERVAQNTGSLIKIDRIAQEMGIPKRQVQKFLPLLQKSFLLDFISPYAEKRVDEIKSHKKIYFLDTGICNYLNQTFNFSSEYLGMLIENFVFLECLKHKKESQNIKFWRTKNGSEIDFIMENILENTIECLEVKSRSTDILPKNIDSFYEYYGKNIKNFYVLNQGKSKQRITKEGNSVKFKPYVLVSRLFEEMLDI